MRKEESKVVDGKTYDIFYPENITLAYNYNYIKLVCQDGASDEYTIRIDKEDEELYKIKAVSFNGEFTADISVMFKLLLDNIEETRTELACVSIYRGDVKIFDFESIVLYAALNLGDRVAMLGTILENYPKHYEKHYIWYKNFPSKYSYLVLEGMKRSHRSDGGQYSEEMEVFYEGILDETEISANETYVTRLKMPTGQTSVFDKSFDYTFFRLGTEDTVIRYTVSDAKDGHFLRWIDRRGFWMCHLFDKGTVETKTTLGSDTRRQFKEYNAINYPQERVLKIEAKQTLKCCATNLDEEQYEDVSTIATACHVDLFLGYDVDGDPIWKPCNISSASHIKSEKKELNDFEISVEYNINTQEL